ncbi:hypothetical protein FQN49_000807 [Arthroderma sp. PD_2]|nr:hypothetical protein FQN49_000807 [Arthroderma sp. PD_2]
MAGRRPTSAPVGSLKIDPDSEDAASAAALYVTHPQRTGFRTSNGLRSTSSKRSSKDVGEYDLASAGAAASYASRGGYARQGQIKKSEAYPSGKSGEEPLSAVGSKAAYRSLRDSGISGLGDEHIKEEDPEARVAASGAMSTIRERVKSMANAPAGVSDLSEALSAATISHRISQHGRPAAERKVEFQLSPKKPYNPAITNSRREMYTSHPPVAITLEENRKRDTLQAAAVSMAQQMYAIMPKEDDTKDMETSSYTMDEPEAQTPRREDSQRGVVGGEPEVLPSEERDSTHRPRSQYFAATKIRPRSSSTADSGRYFVSPAKRSWRQTWHGKQPVGRRDRAKEAQVAAAMSAARRNVNRILDDMDNHINNYHSRPSQAMMKEWERQANERVLANRESAAFDVGPEQLRGEERLVPPRNVDDVARERVRPALHDIDDQVAARKSRRITDKLDEERYQRFMNSQRKRDKEVHKLNKKILGAIRHPERNERPWREEEEKAKDRYGSDEEEELTWPYPPKRASHDAEKEETIFQALDKGKDGTHGEPHPYTPAEQAGESSKSAITEDGAANGVAIVQESAEAEEATKEETAVTEQAGSQAKHVRKQKAVHKTWFTRPHDTAAMEDQPPRQVERIEERIVTEIEKERPTTPSQAANVGSTTPMASGALGVPGSPHYAPSSHWSSSNESGPGSGRGSPGVQKQDESSKPKKRLGLPHFLHRASRRETPGKQGSFAVNRRSVPDESALRTSNVPGQPSTGSLTTPGSRLSRFQENL